MAPALAALTVSAAGAQTLWLSGAVQRDVQEFRDQVVPNRLDGSSAGWTVGAALRLGPLALAAEWSDGGSIEDVRATSLDINGRAATITSTMRHRTRSLAGLAGYTHTMSARVRVVYLLGVARTHVVRRFTSNAGAFVLPGPPLQRAGPGLDDRFESLSGGLDARVRLTRRIHAVGGARVQKIDLSPEVSGWSARTFVGAGWHR
jgi:hypothetical protein